MPALSLAIQRYEATARDYLSDVRQGLVPGAIIYDKFGQNTDIDNADPLTPIWSQTGAYTYMTTAATLYTSCTDNSATQEITFEGLDANWQLQTVTQALNGQTKTEIGSGVTWIRFYRAYNNNSTNLGGDVYIYEDDTPTGGVPPTASKIKAKIEAEDNQTQMAMITVPASKVGRVWSYGGAILAASGPGVTNKAADIKFRTRLFGKVFRVQENIGLTLDGTTDEDIKFTPYRIFPEKTDIEVAAIVSADNTALSGRFTITIEDALT